MATKLENGKWRTQVLISPPGSPRKYKSFYGISEDEADYKALEYKLKKSKESDAENITLYDAVGKYIELRRPVLSPSTIRGYEKIQKNNLGDLGFVLLKNISYIDVQKAVNNLCRDHSPKTAKNVLGLITPAIRLYGNKEIKDIVVPRTAKIEYNTPDSNELGLIFAASAGTQLEIPILLSAWLSLRMSEILGLRWKDIGDNYIQINKALVYDGSQMVEKEPKTEMSKRKILCPEFILEKINKLPQSGERLFQGWTTNKLSKMYSRFLASNNLPQSRFHDLRHANASAMLLLGIPDKYAMERGGWSSLKTMRERYQQTFSPEQKAVADKINSYFLSLVQHYMQQ